MISLTPIQNIDHQFLAIVESVLNNTLKLNTPTDVYVLLMDNWFDHKWLEFESNKYDNDALGWRKKLSLPRFEQSRVLDQSHFRADPSGPMRYRAYSSRPLHVPDDRMLLTQICSSGLFTWYSFVGGSADRGSLMVYLNDEGRGSAWYASFARNPDWYVHKRKGISKLELTELMARPIRADGSQQAVEPEPRSRL